MDVQFVIRVPRPSQVCDGRASPLLSIGVDREVSVNAGDIQYTVYHKTRGPWRQHFVTMRFDSSSWHYESSIPAITAEQMTTRMENEVDRGKLRSPWTEFTKLFIRKGYLPLAGCIR